MLETPEGLLAEAIRCEQLAAEIEAINPLDPAARRYRRDVDWFLNAAAAE